jgi:ATP-dependent DNA ligase
LRTYALQDYIITISPHSSRSFNCDQANVTGSQSQKWKVDKIKSLLVRAKGCESKYIIRGLQGKLRIGLAKNTVLASLSHAVMLTKPQGVVDLTEEELARIRKLDETDGTCDKLHLSGL